MITLRNYQENISSRGVEILGKYGFLYLSMQVRTGKTLTALATCHKLSLQEGVSNRPLNILFLTKKKAITGIEKDIADFGSLLISVDVLNYESLHKSGKKCWDVLILDEAHGLGAFPKPSKRAKDVSAIVKRCKSYVILLSGTPTPESYSQMYHQVYFIPSNPFRLCRNFYSFANSYCRITEKKINGYNIKDYSDASSVIIDMMSPYTIPYTQEEAGFNSVITEHVLVSDMPQEAYQLLSILKKHKVANVASGTILCDTASKYMSKVHQICSGTVICENGKSTVLNNEKAIFIRDYFKGKKIAIFYKFKAEYDALESVFGHTLTSSIEEFNSYPEKIIALQIVSGREGISLREADALVYYNIDFSATSYWQSRDRMTTVDRLKNDVYWVFSKGGIESKIYSSVIKKKDYTLNHFKCDYFL
jgi:hypothetical protein